MEFPSDADAIDHPSSHTSDTILSRDSEASLVELPSPLTADPRRRQHFQEGLDRLATLGADKRLAVHAHISSFHRLNHSSDSSSISSRLSHYQNESSISPSRFLRYPLESHKNPSQLSPDTIEPGVDVRMLRSDQPILGGHEDDYVNDMSSSHSSEPDSPTFHPSLPSLDHRTLAADGVDADTASVDSESVSGDTVSDTFDGPDDDDDSLEDYHCISHAEIPDYPRDAHLQPQEQEHSMSMSEDTVVPANSSSRAGSRVSSYPSSLSARAHQNDQRLPKHIIAFGKAEVPFTTYTSPLRILFVADKDMTKPDEVLLIKKLFSAMTGQKQYSWEGNMSSEEPLPPFAQKNDFLWSGRTFCIETEHAIAYTDKAELVRANGSTLELTAALTAHFAVFYHVKSDSEHEAMRMQSDFPYGQDRYNLARELASRGVPILEISEGRPSFPSVQYALASLDLIKHEVSSLRVEPARSTGQAPYFPVPRDAFLFIENEDLNRHLALIKRDEVVESFKQDAMVVKSDPTPISETFNISWLISKLQNMLHVPYLLAALTVLLCLFLSGRNSMTPRLDAMSDLTFREEALTAALNRSAITSVDASNVLHYPTTTSVTSGSTTIGISFPTAVNVHVARSNQLLVALPSDYHSTAYYNIARNDNKTLGFNTTKLIDGVYVLDLKPADAYGHVNLQVQAAKNSFLNETIKVWLGNRLAHRATYENVARHVQQDLQRDVEDVQFAAKAVQARLLNNTQSALKLSALRARSIRDSLVGTASSAAQKVSLGYQGATNTTTKLVVSASQFLAVTIEKDKQTVRLLSSYAKNATSAVSSLLTNHIPTKNDFARARNNSLKLRSKILRRPAVPLPKASTRGSILGQVKGFRQHCQYAYIDAVASLSAFSKRLSKPHDEVKQDTKQGPRQRSMDSVKATNQAATCKKTDVLAEKR